MTEESAAPTQDFTVLLPVYNGDDVNFFRQAYRSATSDQILPPTHVVVVRDGPVGKPLEEFLAHIENAPSTTVVRLDENRGLAHALNAGLQHVPTQIVARADADDVSLPQRFARQIPMISSGLDIVGSSIVEFVDDPSRPGLVRPAETEPSAITSRARFETPFFHPTVVFRKDCVLSVGGYPEVSLLEDYLLWAELIQAGARVGNCPEPLVAFRVGAGSYDRRGGWRILASEVALQKAFLSMGFVSIGQFLRNIVVRGVYRLLPRWFRQCVYRKRQVAKSRHVGDEGSQDSG